MVRSIRMVGAAIVLGALAFGATGASAGGFHGGMGGHGGFHGGFGGFHGGFHGVGIHLGGWGGGWGWGRGWGFRGVGFRPAYGGGCYIQRYVDIYGEIAARRVCY